MYTNKRGHYSFKKLINDCNVTLSLLRQICHFPKQHYLFQVRWV